MDKALILYIKAAGNDCEIWLASESGTAGTLAKRRVLASVPMGTLLKEYLAENSFLQIHRSVAINYKHLSSISGNEVTLTGDVKLPIGSSYKQQLLTQLEPI